MEKCFKSTAELVVLLIYAYVETIICITMKGTDPNVCPRTVNSNTGTQTKLILECCPDYIYQNGKCQGYTGFNCSNACPSGKYGLSCSEECFCAHNAECDPVTGGCLCSAGWFGPLCTKECTLGTFGKNCSGICDCPDGSKCEIITGNCISLKVFDFILKTSIQVLDNAHSIDIANRQLFYNPTDCWKLNKISVVSGEKDDPNSDREIIELKVCHQEFYDYNYSLNCSESCKCKTGSMCDKQSGICECKDDIFCYNIMKQQIPKNGTSTNHENRHWKHRTRHTNDTRNEQGHYDEISLYSEIRDDQLEGTIRTSIDLTEHFQSEQSVPQMTTDHAISLPNICTIEDEYLNPYCSVQTENNDYLNPYCALRKYSKNRPNRSSENNVNETHIGQGHYNERNHYSEIRDDQLQDTMRTSSGMIENVQSQNSFESKEKMILECCPDYYVQNGTCQACIAGRYGKDCQLPYLPNYYGIQCKQLCNCSHNKKCNPVQGCVCNEGFNEPNANIANECHQGFYNISYNLNCSDTCFCRNDPFCNPRSEICECSDETLYKNITKKPTLKKPTDTQSPQDSEAIGDQIYQGIYCEINDDQLEDQTRVNSIRTGKYNSEKNSQHSTKDNYRHIYTAKSLPNLCISQYLNPYCSLQQTDNDYLNPYCALRLGGRVSSCSNLFTLTDTIDVVN
ncbi:unnamed protein product [Mytilus coruscus]|uniref:EGF-like domain-containing protein n=1 Tax=Mytilus coruscus TaxID=42192 RepID=A0A6J8CNE0_MYTCO|nr:unnamed protein product [Mytilus coruscus]